MTKLGSGFGYGFGNALGIGYGNGWGISYGWGYGLTAGAGLRNGILGYGWSASPTSSRSEYVWRKL